MELKWKKNLSNEELEDLADEALAQINTLKYDSEMKNENITNILKFGIAFSGQKVKVKAEQK